MDTTHYEADAEGKSRVIGRTSNGTSVGNFDDDKISDARAAETACPVNVITVTET